MTNDHKYVVENLNLVLSCIQIPKILVNKPLYGNDM